MNINWKLPLRGIPCQKITFLLVLIMLSTFSLGHAEDAKMLAGKKLVVIVKTANVGEAGMAF